MRPLRYHHTHGAAHITPGVHRAAPVSDRMARPACTGTHCAHDDYHGQKFYDVAYAWLAERIGFWPLFMTVGTDVISQWATGYFHQFRRGAQDARVMFSYRDIPADGAFIDDGAWTAVLCHLRGTGCGDWHIDGVDDHLVRTLLAPHRARDGWLARARNPQTPVQLVVPALDMAGADRILCRSRRAADALLAQGFDAARIFTGRVPVDPFSDGARFSAPVALSA